MGRLMPERAEGSRGGGSHRDSVQTAAAVIARSSVMEIEAAPTTETAHSTTTYSREGSSQRRQGRPAKRCRLDKRCTSEGRAQTTARCTSEGGEHRRSRGADQRRCSGGEGSHTAARLRPTRDRGGDLWPGTAITQG